MTKKQSALFDFIQQHGWCPCSFVARSYYGSERPMMRLSAGSVMAAMAAKGWLRGGFDEFGIMGYKVTSAGIKDRANRSTKPSKTGEAPTEETTSGGGEDE